jgi:hypothetical protein
MLGAGKRVEVWGREPRRTIPVTAGGCQVSKGGNIKGKCYV